MADLDQKVIGFRRWVLRGQALESSAGGNAGVAWKWGMNRAECRAPEWAPSFGVGHRLPLDLAEHTAPAPSCSCGFYAYHDFAKANLTRTTGLAPFVDDGLHGDEVGGAIAAWGRIEVHHDGFRAERAEPVVLAYDPSQPYRHVVKLQALGAEYGVPVVEVDELEAAAATYGASVPVPLRPPRAEIDERHLWIQMANPSVHFRPPHYLFTSVGFVDPAVPEPVVKATQRAGEVIEEIARRFSNKAAKSFAALAGIEIREDAEIMSPHFTWPPRSARESAVGLWTPTEGPELSIPGLWLPELQPLQPRGP